jgi:hypothetical protein
MVKAYQHIIIIFHIVFVSYILHCLVQLYDQNTTDHTQPLYHPFMQS